MSNKLPPNFNPEKAGTKKEEEEHCRHCDQAPCNCQRLENKMDERRRNL